MTRRTALDPSLHRNAVLARDRELHGATPKRLRGADVQHPFHGVVAADLDLGDVVDMCRAFLPQLKPDEAFSHLTAAQLFDIPLPAALTGPSPVHVTSFNGSQRRGRGVAGHRSTPRLPVVLHLGLPVIAAAETWCHLGAVLPREELVVAADRLLTGSRTDAGALPPLCDATALRQALARHAGRRGSVRLGWAIERARKGAASRTETLLRLLLTAYGLPEPEVQHPVHVHGEVVVHPDLAYPDHLIAIEYEGDAHRSSRRRWMNDLTRYELLQDLGWRVVRVHADDLFVEPQRLVERIRAALQRVESARIAPSLR